MLTIGWLVATVVSMAEADTRTLEEAKRWLRERFSEGADCPCCNQFVKLYKRKLNGSMSLALIYIYKYFESNPAEQWLHVPSYLSRIISGATVRGGDWSKLRYWGLIEDQKGTRDDGSERVGNYRITEEGKKFVQGLTRVPRHVFLYNQEPVKRRDEETTSIQESLGEDFNYNELMANQ
jgi:hypothetical protein